MAQGGRVRGRLGGLTGNHVAALPERRAPCKRGPHRCLAALARQSAAGPVAQWLEPAAHNGLVAGSSPAGPTSEINTLSGVVSPVNYSRSTAPTRRGARSHCGYSAEYDNSDRPSMKVRRENVLVKSNTLWSGSVEGMPITAQHTVSYKADSSSYPACNRFCSRRTICEAVRQMHK